MNPTIRSRVEPGSGRPGKKGKEGMLHGTFYRRTPLSSGKGAVSVTACHVSPFEKPGSQARGPGALVLALALLFGSTGVVRAAPLVTDFKQKANEDPTLGTAHWIG